MDALKLAELLSSSSSSEDEEVFSVIALVFNSVTKRIKVDNFGAPISSYTNEEFRKHFRVSRTTLDFLAKRYAKFNPRNLNHGGVPQPDNIVHILSFLWFAGNKSTIREVANLFNTSESSCHKYINKVMDFFIQLAPSVIKFPRSTQEKEVASREFERISGIPDVIGCIDGSYIPCRTPAHKIRSTYINRHDMVSITLQGICDSRRRFLDVFCGPPSKIYDSRIFHLSFISKCLPRICGRKHHLLADSAYPLREWLITPYKESPNLDETHSEFNKRFCATRVIIENTFALIKQRFRQLIRLDFHTVDTMSKFVLSCCVLHNMCIDNDDNWEENYERDSQTTHIEVSSTVTVSGTQHLRNKGEIKRYNLKNVIVGERPQI